MTTKRSGGARQRPAGSRSRRHWLLASLIVVGVLIIAGGAFVGYAASYAGRFPARMRIGPVAVGGLNYLEALSRVSSRVDAFLDAGLVFGAADKQVTLLPAVGAQDEFSYTLYDIDATASVQTAFNAVQSGSRLLQIVHQVRSLAFGWSAPLALTSDAEAFRKALQENFSSIEQPARDAQLVVAPKTQALSVVAEQAGFRFDYSAAIRLAVGQAGQLDRTSIGLARVADQPAVTSDNVKGLEPTAKAALQRAPLTLTAGDKSFPVSATALGEALTVTRTKTGVGLALDADNLDALDTIAKAVEVPVQEGRFQMTDGKVTEFAESRVGKQLDRDATAAALAQRLTAGDKTVAVVLKDVAPVFSSDTASTLGIKELVAQGKTNFGGSPVNRRFNIGVGAAKLNGLLIQPGEEFSLIKALGKIDGKNGFRQELVIKGDRTIPEFGGGLCQIGTTFFRLVLNSGLPILERQNHSYRVRYYEPPVGMDATIYEPKPDFRFKNDYAAPLLLQTRIEGDDLIFEFYGTKDARKVEMTTPRVFNIKAPPAKKTIETTDLKPGEVKCVEKAHPGSDAEFTYTVTSAAGEKIATVFKSHYRPWGEICLLGVKEIKKPAKPAE